MIHIIFDIPDSVFGLVWLHHIDFDAKLALPNPKPNKRGAPGLTQSYRFVYDSKWILNTDLGFLVTWK